MGVSDKLKPLAKVEPGYSASDARKQLLALTPGIQSCLNNVPVKRQPCDGEWFEVGVHEDYPCITWQRLRLVDAISRVKSGYFPKLKPPPDLKAYYERLREEQRVELNARVCQDEPEVLR